MITNDLKTVVQLSRLEKLPKEYIKIQLKELLIHYALDFIYNSKKWHNLVFNGGTALKVIGNTSRLSEDLDLDYLGNKINIDVFADELINYFNLKGLKDVSSSIRNRGIVTLKFPILKQFGLITNIKNESNFLHLKIELEKNKYSSFKLQQTALTVDNLFLVASHYDLPTLFANKVGAILGRKDKIYHNKYDFKGRDFYDLIWFLQKGIKPNLARVKQIVKKEQNKVVKNYDDLWSLIRKRIEEIDSKGIFIDMKNLVKSEVSVKKLAVNYLTIYDNLIASRSKL